MTRDELAIYQKHTKRESPPSEQVAEAWMCIGRGGGKTKNSKNAKESGAKKPAAKEVAATGPGGKRKQAKKEVAAAAAAGKKKAAVPQKAKRGGGVINVGADDEWD